MAKKKAGRAQGAAPRKDAPPPQVTWAPSPYNATTAYAAAGPSKHSRSLSGPTWTKGTPPRRWLFCAAAVPPRPWWHPRGSPTGYRSGGTYPPRCGSTPQPPGWRPQRPTVELSPRAGVEIVEHLGREKYGRMGHVAGKKRVSGDFACAVATTLDAVEAGPVAMHIAHSTRENSVGD